MAVMDKRHPPALSPAAARDRREEVLARIEAALRADAPGMDLVQHDTGGLDPYTTHSGPIRRDAWGPRAR